ARSRKNCKIASWGLDKPSRIVYVIPRYLASPSGRIPAMTSPTPASPRLLDQLADALRTRGYVAALRQASIDWVLRYVLYHQVRHPQEMGAAEVGAFLDHLASQTDLAPAAEVEARAALTFLHEIVLGNPLGELPTAVGRLETGATASLTACG